MSSKPEYTMKDDDLYRLHLRQHFMGQVKNAELKQKFRQTYFPAVPSQHLKEQTLNSKEKTHELESSSIGKQKNVNQAPTSGGDADRMLYYTSSTKHHGGDSFRVHGINDAFPLKSLPNNSKSVAPALTSNANASSRRYPTTPVVDDFIGDHSYLYESDSNLGGVGHHSQDSAKSQKSSKTVVSRKSSQDLRNLVTSQCKLHELIDESIKEMCKTDVENTVENGACGLQGETPTQYPLTLTQCKKCSDRIHTAQSQKDVMTETGKGDFLDSRSTTTLTISVDDVINSRVINPMIHKLHRMYLNNLQEEMSLMEDLERLPNKVNEVYKSLIFKPKD